MKTYGVQQQDLVPKAYEFFLEMCDQDETVAKMRSVDVPCVLNRFDCVLICRRLHVFQCADGCM